MVVQDCLRTDLVSSPLKNDKKHRLKQRFDVQRKLGQGTYGKVQLAVNRETGQEEQWNVDVHFRTKVCLWMGGDDAIVPTKDQDNTSVRIRFEGSSSSLKGIRGYVVPRQK
ncbi:hypothetical protein CEXT_94481 [Caerostris extrusa]|uniref:Protein kinase domain-containing protein n=1 Tax=Caerostris extrusa TaxID=172846 RepID=A0AAV4Y2J2_CAEEX|nr:hypothetical protein CEXT_94481 [Caerostris extrusa]